MASLSTSWARFFLPALLVFAMAARARTATDAGIETVADSEGRFVVSLPGPVQRNEQEVDSPAGRVTMKTVLHDGGAQASFMVIYSDYPTGTVARAGGPDQVCKNASKAALKGMNDGALRSSSPCQLGEIKGLEIIADNSPDHSVNRIRFFVVGDRLYQVIFAGPAGGETSPEARAFFDSFHLTP